MIYLQKQSEKNEPQLVETDKKPEIGDIKQKIIEQPEAKKSTE